MSDIASRGGEAALIQRLALLAGDGAGADVILGIGDDCAVLPHRDGQVLLVTTDMLVEGRHFRRDWCTGRQIGIRAAEANLSDIAAMGGSPHWAFTSVALPGDCAMEHALELGHGLLESFNPHGVTLAGGDTCRGEALVLSVTLLGVAPEGNVRRRSDALVGDLLAVSGTLGKAQAGLELLRAGRQEEGDTSSYLEPRCRLDLVPSLAPHVRAMIDVSDGLASEVRHICTSSGVGAELEREAIPVSAETCDAAARLGQDPVAWALSGGEDFELLFSASPDHMAQILDGGVDATVIGEVTAQEDGIWLLQDGQRGELGSGFDHFAGEDDDSSGNVDGGGA